MPSLNFLKNIYYFYFGCTGSSLLCSMWGFSLPTQDQAHIPCIGRWVLNHGTTRDVPRSNLCLKTCSWVRPAGMASGLEMQLALCTPAGISSFAALGSRGRQKSRAFSAEGGEPRRQ